MRIGGGELELDNGRTPTRALLSQTWQSRELVRILSRKNFYVRYRRTVLGMLWVVGLPLMQALVMALIFSKFRTGRAPGGSFAAYLLSGYMVWNFFSSVVSGGATAIVDGSALSSKIYFPRIVLPLVSMATNLYGFGATVVVMSTVALTLRGSVEPTLPLLIGAVALAAALSLSLSIVLSALHVYFRDIRYLVTAVMQPWFFLTPVLWSATQMPDSIRSILKYNPAAGPVELAHLALLGAVDDGWATSVWSSLVCTAVLMVVGLRLHTRHDRVFGDLL